MEVSHTKKSTRVLIWIVTIVMAGGFIGTYFLIIINNEQQQALQDRVADTSAAPEPQGTVDPTAYKTTDPVAELQITDLKVGEGETVKLTDTVTAHYKGTLATTGQKFDSSYDRGEPITIPLSQVIQGWQDGVPGMKVGGKRRLVIPASLGYGSAGSTTIPPNSDLVFEIEVLGVSAGQTAQ